MAEPQKRSRHEKRLIKRQIRKNTTRKERRQSGKSWHRNFRDEQKHGIDQKKCGPGFVRIPMKSKQKPMSGSSRVPNHVIHEIKEGLAKRRKRKK